MDFFKKIDIINNGCWIWLGQKNDRGYGRLQYNNKIISIHRIIYTIFKGKIPNNLELDHLCRNHSCCNPDHLEAVTHKINIQRGSTGKHKGHLKGINHYCRKKTHCPKNHEYNDENTYIDSNNKRHCRLCFRINSKKYYKKRVMIK